MDTIRPQFQTTTRRREPLDPSQRLDPTNPDEKTINRKRAHVIAIGSAADCSIHSRRTKAARHSEKPTEITLDTPQTCSRDAGIRK